MTCRVVFVTGVTIFVLLYSLSCLILPNLKGAPDTDHVIFRRGGFGFTFLSAHSVLKKGFSFLQKIGKSTAYVALIIIEDFRLFIS